MIIVIIELDEVSQLIERLRHLFLPDLPAGDHETERTLLTDTEDLLQIHLKLLDCEPTPELEEGLEVCEDLLHAIHQAQAWQRSVTQKLKRLRLLSTRGTLALYLEGDERVQPRETKTVVHREL